MKAIKKIFFLMLVMIIVSVNVYADEFRDSSTLNVSFVTENNSLTMENVDINIYKLATFDNEDYSVKWNDIYNDFKFDLETVTDEELISTSYDLGDFVKEKNISSDYKLTTDLNGDASITFENGIYLVCAEQVVENEVIYTPYPCIVQMPYTEDDGSFNYEADIQLKYYRKELEKQVIEEPAPTPTPQKQNNTINTGDLVPIVSGVVILLSIIVILVILQKKKKNNKNNDK